MDEPHLSLPFCHHDTHIFFRLLKYVSEGLCQLCTITTINISMIHHKITIHYISNLDSITLHYRLLRHCINRQKHTPVGKGSKRGCSVLKAKTSNRCHTGTSQRIFHNSHERQIDPQPESNEREYFREKANQKCWKKLETPSLFFMLFSSLILLH